MNRGYVKLWRKSKDSIVFGNEGLWKLWCLCLMKAAWKKKDVTVPGVLRPVELMPGQFVMGRYSIHLDYHQGRSNPNYSQNSSPTPLTLYRWLKKLAEWDYLNIKSRNKYSIITICNWSKDQSLEHLDEHQDEHQLEHKEELKKELIEEVIDYLNTITGKKYRHNSQKSQKHIGARWNEGYTLENFQKVIRVKSNQWLRTKDEKYLRPETLFGTKFEGYVNEPELKPQTAKETKEALYQEAM